MGITGATRVYAVVGRPVRRSSSPALHNAWFAAHGIDAVYVALEVPEGSDDGVVDAIRALGLAGANVTVPLKERVVRALDRVDPLVELVGAVNTVAVQDGTLVGANTDVGGFCRAVEAQGVSLAGRDAVIVGAGGAARAVAVGLAQRGAARIRFASRKTWDGEQIASTLARPFPTVAWRAGAIDDEALAGADLVVVATSGRPEVLAGLDLAALGADAVWVDLNYWDPDPVAFRAAAAAGCRTISGHAMLRWQAALSFERWTGILPDARADVPQVR